jgi:hypothetical protein
MAKALKPEAVTPELRSEQRLNEILHVNKVLEHVAPISSGDIEKIEFDQAITNHHVTAVAETVLYLVDKAKEQPLTQSYEGHALNELLKMCDQVTPIGHQSFNMLELALTIGALLHDIGKAKAPSNIIKKKAGFNKKDRETLEEHTLYSLLEITSDQENFIANRTDIPFNLIKFLAFMHHYKYVEDEPSMIATGLPNPSPSVKVINKVFGEEPRFSQFKYVKNSIREVPNDPNHVSINLLEIASKMGVIDDLNRMSGGQFSEKFRTNGEMQVALQSLVNLIHISDIITRSMFGTLHDKKQKTKDEIFYAINYYKDTKVPYSPFTEQQLIRLFIDMRSAEEQGKVAAKAIYHKPNRYTGGGTSPLHTPK